MYLSKRKVFILYISCLVKLRLYFTVFICLLQASTGHPRHGGCKDSTIGNNGSKKSAEHKEPKAERKFSEGIQTAIGGRQCLLGSMV